MGEYVMLSQEILSRVCAYSSENVLMRLFSVSSRTYQLISSQDVWSGILRQADIKDADNSHRYSLTTMQSIYRATVQNYGYSLLEKVGKSWRVAYGSPVASLCIGENVVWVLTVAGGIWSRLSSGEWIASPTRDKIRKIRRASDDSIVAIGDDFVYIAKPYNTQTLQIMPTTHCDYYYTNGTITPVYDNTTDIAAITLRRYHDSDVTHTMLLRAPLYTSEERLREMELVPLSYHSNILSNRWSLSGNPGYYSMDLDLRLTESYMTRAENDITYIEPGYDAENVRDIIGEFENSKYFGEDDGF